MAQTKHISYYTNTMQNWTKELGPKPTETQLAVAHVFGRPGKQSLAVAMALRDGGASGAQIKLAAGLADGKHTPQLNHMRSLVAGREFERLPVPGVYALKLTKTGQQRIDAVTAKAGEAKADKPVKTKAGDKAAKKPRKGKQAATGAVAGETAAPAPVAETATGEAVTA